MFYGWRIVGGSFLSQAFVIGFFTYAVSLLTQPVQESFDVSVEMVMYSLTLGTFAGLFAMPVAGVLLDKLSLRALFAAGIVLFALGLWLLGQTTTIVQYIVVFGITMALANALAGAMISSAVVSRWFIDNRGKALGIAATGTSVGGVLIPGLVTYWLPDYGWRGTLENLSIVMLLIVLPVVLWTIRSWPSEVGIELSAEGEGADADAAAAQLGLGYILRNANFWWLAVSLGPLFSTYTAILSNLTPYAKLLGHGEVSASGLIMIIAVCGLLGKLIFGVAADKVGHKVALWAAQLLQAAGLVLLALEPAYYVIVLACISLGLAAGGMLPVWGALIADLFGLQSYGRAFGLMGPIITLFVMMGFPLVGRLFDVTGSFSLGLWISAALMAVAAILLVPLRLSQES
ncbi:MFS transporter [Seongchinamella sediminis]|uniref:MFS transporter n=2 Tax=Seongchinamella sediminis TaxID=2283635 RepID=A0A3L7DSY4_9GAMM|nr:MFS transporter [Seongchinamella sediminis]